MINIFFFFQHLYNFNWENLELHGTQTNVSNKPGNCLTLLDHWVHSFLVRAINTQEVTAENFFSVKNYTSVEKIQYIFTIIITSEKYNTSQEVFPSTIWSIHARPYERGTWNVAVSSCVSGALTGNEWTQWSSRLRHFPSLWGMWVWAPPGPHFSQLKL